MRVDATLGDLDDEATALGALPLKVEGGDGNDRLTGGAGKDDLDGGEGDDVLAARDGVREDVVCGGGADSGEADIEDEVAADCESVFKPLAPPGPRRRPARGCTPAVAGQELHRRGHDVFLDGADSLLGGRPVEALAIGAASTATASVTLPDDLATGTYFLFAKADGPGAITEVNETNNHRASAISIGPDVLVTSFTAPAAASAGSVIAVSDTTANQGSAPAPASITSFYLSSNVVFDAGDVLLGSRGLAALAAGGTSTAARRSHCPQRWPPAPTT